MLWNCQYCGEEKTGLRIATTVPWTQDMRNFAHGMEPADGWYAPSEPFKVNGKEVATLLVCGECYASLKAAQTVGEDGAVAADGAHDDAELAAAVDASIATAMGELRVDDDTELAAALEASLADVIEAERKVEDEDDEAELAAALEASLRDIADVKAEDEADVEAEDEDAELKAAIEASLRDIASI